MEETEIEMIRKSNPNDINRIAEIWLDTNIKVHSFIPQDYWKNYSEKIKKRIRGLFDLMLSDNKKARTEDYHGKYSMIKCEGQPCNSQEMLYQEAYDRAAIKTENKVVE